MSEQAEAHLDLHQARAFVSGYPVDLGVTRHVLSGCEPCHGLIQSEFDRILVAIEAAEDPRVVGDWLAALGERYARRHCCPLTLVEDHDAGDERAHRHLRHCTLCADEFRDLADLSRLLTP